MKNVLPFWLHVSTYTDSSYKLCTHYVYGSINGCLFSQNIFF